MELIWIAVALVAVVYVLDVAIYWRKPCRKCKGAGKFSSPLTKDANRPCPRCGGSGKRVRWGWIREKR